MKLPDVPKGKKGYMLDIGSGSSVQPGFVGMDIQEYNDPNIITHNWDNFPWPFPDESVLTAVGSHVIEHVNPVNGHFLKWMNELWRIMIPGGQVVFAYPYAGSEGMFQDPTHCNFVNQATWYYFDPLHPSNYYQFYEPAPWAIELNAYHKEGNGEVVLRKRLDDISYHKDGKKHYGK